MGNLEGKFIVMDYIPPAFAGPLIAPPTLKVQQKVYVGLRNQGIHPTTSKVVRFDIILVGDSFRSGSQNHCTFPDLLLKKYMRVGQQHCYQVEVVEHNMAFFTK